MTLNEECDVELQTATFTPVVEYDYGSSTFCGPPAVGQIVDSNGSGAIDTDDMNPRSSWPAPPRSRRSTWTTTGTPRSPSAAPS
ncbi:MAG: hypothetical protein Q8P18_15790 [Pseudomonadota bacterium]|nr:hypothetical protein [Pseudomonadota bacterium]